MSSAERVRRIATAAALPIDDEGRQSPQLLVDLGFAFDPLWLAHLAGRPGAVLTLGGRAVIAHVGDPVVADMVAAAMAHGDALPDGTALEVIAFETGGRIYNTALRKLEQPFVERLEPDSVRAVERKSYQGAYKGVTDILTKYLWPQWAFLLTRVAARIGISPNGVTAIGAVLCVIATLLFWRGDYWPGLAAGLAFMVLDTVDGKLARCTITSSWWGNIFDHGMDLIHPPFWWFAWAVGLGAWGLAFTPTIFWAVQAILFAGYVLQRLIEGAFIKAFGMHIHVWRKCDSDFRLVTARRNPNMAILFFAMPFARPDIGLLAVTGWTVLSLLVHAVQFIQAAAARRRGETLTSWLAG